MPAVPTRSLTGWGRTAPTSARVHVPSSPQEVAELVAERIAGEPAGRMRGLLARGLGRCYGDAAQSAGGDVLSTEGLGGIELEGTTGLAVVGAGVSLDRLLRVVVPRGWFVPVTPGTRYVTVGGAIAADVHGKNHHVDGSFGGHVAWLELVDGTGRLRRLAPDGEAEEARAFWATVGGLGLTGVVTRVAVQLRPVASAWIDVRTERAHDLASLMATLREHDRRHRYTVAWVDVLARGRRAGRGVLTSGDHAAAEAVLARGHDPLAYAPAERLAAPPLPAAAVGPVTARLFDALWYAKAPTRPRDTVERLESFFHPLDGVRSWNRLYGPRGFVQYQFVVPDDREDVVERAVGELGGSGAAPFLGVLKRFGAAGPAPLSFPRPGWTLAVDLPAGRPGRLAPVLDRLDEAVAAAGGAVYLVKDSRVRPDLLGAFYPRLAEWRSVRDGLDPHRLFASDLSRRLGL